MGLAKGEILEVSIEKLIFGGAGLARVEGQVVFVDFVAPEDLVEIEIIESKKNFSRGKVKRIINASPRRVEPRCPVFGRCGGCQWQHVHYDTQIESKQKILQEIIKRFLPEWDGTLGEFKKSPQEYHYRNRIDLHIDLKGSMGFFAKQSHDIVEIESCYIAEEALNQELKKLKRAGQSSQGQGPLAGKYRLQKGRQGEVTHSHIETQESPLGFAQVNQEQNTQLQTEIIETYLKNYLGQPIIDLYGGYGNFSIPLAENLLAQRLDPQKFPSFRIECVEWSQKSVEEGISFAQQKQLSSVHFINMDVQAYLQRLKMNPESFVIIDPPREGCSPAVIKELSAKAPQCLVYISCDPMTWGRDVQLFLLEAQRRNHKYRIATIHGLDMFPQTDHIEVFSVFERC